MGNGEMLFWNKILFIVDTLLIATSVYTSLVMRFGYEEGLFKGALDPFQTFTGASFITVTITLFVFYAAQLYDIEIGLKTVTQVMRIVLSVVVATIITSFVFYWIPIYRMYRLAEIYHIAISMSLLATWRIFFFKTIYQRLPKRNTVIVGTGELGKLITRVLNDQANSKYRPIGVVEANGEGGVDNVEGLKVIGNRRDLEEILKEKKINNVIVATEEKMDEELIKNLMNGKMSGVEVKDAVSTYREITGKIPLRYIDRTWFIFGPEFQIRRSGMIRATKRTYDIFIASIGLVVSLPLMIVIGLLIKLSSRGRVIYKQKRMGENENVYYLYKFRTMIENAEKETGAVWSQKEDPRVTKIGRILRRTRLDELPQFWNIIKGEMSFVGPRPERPEFVERLKEEIPYYSMRQIIKPGLTGWAQVNYGYGSTDEQALEKLQYDLYYLQEMSIYLDLTIMLRTIKTVLFKVGS
ncbi:MAG: sugar transferase [bacterium]|nr:sugar transferase [bacterium]